MAASAGAGHYSSTAAPAARPGSCALLLIAYTSVASFDFSDGDLITLLMNSRATNKGLGLTGILLYSDRHFVQILEGENAVVNARFERIAADPRHHDVALILREETTERQFPKWTMGYKSLSDPMVSMIPGYDSFFSDAPEQAASAARRLLERFRTDVSLSASVTDD